ncbi:MAG TPA: Smr/MutS family protein [Burkholderiales bacterium]|nr:Smr/MutS family protein [Burkholderiales bacterium]
MAWPPDKEDWQAGVEPLPEPRRRALPRPRPAPLPRETWRDERAALAESLGPMSPEQSLESGEELAFVRGGYAPGVLRKLRRGHWVVEASLDLHGLNRAEAAAAVRQFLRECRARRLGCLRIVHGKGLGSRNREPVLKGKVYHWLKMRDEVLAFAQAPSAHGGAGAVLVLLKT